MHHRLHGTAVEIITGQRIDLIGTVMGIEKLFLKIQNIYTYSHGQGDSSSSHHSQSSSVIPRPAINTCIVSSSVALAILHYTNRMRKPSITKWLSCQFESCTMAISIACCQYPWQNCLINCTTWLVCCLSASNRCAIKRCNGNGG